MNAMPAPTVAILYIATGRYTVFWEPFYRSAERFLLPDCRKHYFLFTDSPETLAGEDGASVTRIHQPKLGWPHDTLMRFHIFLGIKEQLARFDYIYFFNGNSEILSTVSREDLLPLLPHERLVLLRQPHMTHLTPDEFTYDRNPKSTACIPKGRGEYYFAGGLNGGRTEAYLEMCETLRGRVQQDLDNGVIALWHDESQLNRYALGRSDLKILPRYFSRGETEPWKQSAKVMFSDKTHHRFGGHAYLRGETDRKISAAEWEENLRIPADAAATAANPAGVFARDARLMRRLRTLNSKPYKFFYRLLVPKPLRNRLNARANARQQKHVAACWEQFLRAYFCGLFPHFSLQAKQNLQGRKIIWQYWAQGWDEAVLPETVRLCARSVEQHRGAYEIIRLHDGNLRDYVDFPDFVWEKRRHPEFKHAFFADLLRLALLDLYGGAWLDATILLTGPLPEGYLKEAGFFMFQRSPDAGRQEEWRRLNADYFGWHSGHQVAVLNSFIMAEAGNSVIRTCLDIMLNYWQTQTRIPHYFFFQIMFRQLMRLYFADRQCPVIDDTLPHLLFARIRQPFDAAAFADLTRRVSVHKLTYLDKCPPGSYYHHLQQQYGTETPSKAT